MEQTDNGEETIVSGLFRDW